MKNIIWLSAILMITCSMASAQTLYDALRAGGRDFNQLRQDQRDNVYYMEKIVEAKEKELMDKRMQVASQVLQIKQWYVSQPSVPETPDGNYSAYATDNDLFAGTVQIEVVGQKIVKVGTLIPNTSTTIQSGKGQITAIDNGNAMHILDIYIIR